MLRLLGRQAVGARTRSRSRDVERVGAGTAPYVRLLFWLLVLLSLGMNLVLFFVLVCVFVLSPISDEVTQLCSTSARASDHGKDFVLFPQDLEKVCGEC